MLRVLLTNDDGIHADGLQCLRRALVALEDVQLAVIAPDENMSATARSITTRRPLWVTEVPFDDGTHGFSCDGTPVDCVRLASLGLVDDFEPDLVVAGINHGSNLGDDITYSGTVAAAIEGIVLGVPGHRGLAAVAGARDGLPARQRVRLRDRRRVHRARGRPDRRRPAARGHAAEHQRPRRSRGRGRRGAARQADLPRRPAPGGQRGRAPAPVPGLRRLARPRRRGGHRPRRRGRRADRRDAAALRPQRRARHGRRCGRTTSPSCSRPPPRRSPSECAGRGSGARRRAAGAGLPPQPPLSRPRRPGGRRRRLRRAVQRAEGARDRVPGAGRAELADPARRRGAGLAAAEGLAPAADALARQRALGGGAARVGGPDAVASRARGDRGSRRSGSSPSRRSTGSRSR